MSDMDEVLKEFLVESNENLDQLDRDLVALEKDSKSPETLASIFRTIHTIKGTCGFLGFTKLEALTHSGENLLSRLRDGSLKLTPKITSALLALVDAVRRMLAAIEATGKDGEDDCASLIGLLSRLQVGAVVGEVPSSADKGGLRKNVKKKAAGRKAVKLITARAVPATSDGDPRPVAGKTVAPVAAASPSRPPGAHPATGTTGHESAEKEDVVAPLGEVLTRDGLVEPGDVDEALQQQRDGDPRRVGEILVDRGTVTPVAVVEALHEQQQARELAVSGSSIRVDVGLLDKLMNLVGELVLARNQILQFSATQPDSAFLNTSQRLNLITTELQEGVMKTRMQPIGNIWSKFPRVVRDLALACGKQVRIDMEGKDTELDKTIIEAIKDPLTHLVRNVVDHGIESPAVRLRLGKPEEGRLFLRAFHEGGQVNIEISDDGGGIDLEKVKQKALERGLFTGEHVARMSDREALNLICLPGFSTADKVTNVSGRGVGMDVVKTNIEKIGGTVDIQNRPGQGATFKIKIPLTLAIIPALIVTSAGARYAIPQVSLQELVRLEAEQARKGIEMIHGAPVYRLRGHLLPLVYLKRELHLSGTAQHLQVEAPTSTLAGAAASAEILDFALARNKHQQWFDQLRQLLDGKITMTVEEAGSPKECALGKWLYSSGLKKYGDIAAMHELEKVHTGFHALVRNIVELKATGHLSQAEQEFRELLPSSQEITDLLVAVEKKVAESQNVNIVVLQADDRQFGLVVDEINDTEEIVVKPMGNQLKGLGAFAGATIMGDGQVALILDVLGLAQRASVVTEVRERGIGDKAAQSEERADGHQSLLLLRGPDDGRMAIPLALIARLEEFDDGAVEKTGGQMVVQYRRQILPLIALSGVLTERRQQPRKPVAGESTAAEQKIQVVVYSDQGKSVGLVVDRILDIVETRLETKRPASREGTLGSAVIQGRVTELLDVAGIIHAAHPPFLEARTAALGQHAAV